MAFKIMACKVCYGQKDYAHGGYAWNGYGQEGYRIYLYSKVIIFMKETGLQEWAGWDQKII